MGADYFFTIKETSEDGTVIRYTTLIEEFRERVDVIFIKGYFSYSLNQLKELFKSIYWVKENEIPYEKTSKEYIEYLNHYENGDEVKYLISHGSVEAVVQLNNETLTEMRNDLDKLKKAEAKKTREKFIPSKRKIYLETNIEKVDGEFRLKLLNVDNYINNPDWKYGFIFDLDNDTLEICSRELMDKQSVGNMVMKKIDRNTIYSEDLISL